MEIQINDNKLSVLNVEQIFSQIEEYILANDLFLNYIVVDGVEVFEGFSEYITANVGSESNIDVKVLSRSEFLSEYKAQLEVQATQLLKLTEEMANSYYKVDSNWNNTDELINHIEALIRFKEDYEQLLIASQEEKESEIGNRNKLDAILGQVSDAFESKDSIYLADIFHHELVKWLGVYVR